MRQKILEKDATIADLNKNVAFFEKTKFLEVRSIFILPVLTWIQRVACLDR